MKPIKKLAGVITKIIDLSPTAREVIITLSEPLEFEAGSFVNIFIDKDGEKLRRAFSISSSNTETKQISVSIRLTPNGAVTPLFWEDNIIGTPVELMGPLGLNTADKMFNKRIFLFGFGVGAGVVKSVAEHFSRQSEIESIVIMTGNRSEEDILHRDFFDKLAEQHSNVAVSYILSVDDPSPNYKKGYIQNHLNELDFNNSDVYVCGQEVACNALVETIKSYQPENCHFFIEAFH